jgi:hypothetical protein
MPRTIEITAYRFDELSDRAKERARDWYREGDTWGWSDEYWQSARAFAAIAPMDIWEADYSRGDVSVRWAGDDEVAELTGLRAWKWLANNGWFDLAAKNIQGDCTLTGFCGDCDLFDPIAQYAKNPLRVPELEQVFRECYYSWVHAARADMEHSYSDESVDESIRINEYEFDAEGNRL